MAKQKTKFIIFGQGRSGSNLLVDLLNSHPDIYCDRELLNKSRLKRKYKFIRPLIYAFPYKYIATHLRKHSENIYGFKLMYHQIRKYRGFLTKLSDDGWKIIHIQRKDTLKQAFSGIIARKKGSYVRKAGIEIDSAKVYIDPIDVVKSLKVRTRALEYEMKALQGLKYLDVVYENDLAESSLWGKSTKRVFNFLNVGPVEVHTSMLKTDDRTYEERISNYQEILEYLKNNGYGNFIK